MGSQNGRINNDLYDLSLEVLGRTPLPFSKFPLPAYILSSDAFLTCGKAFNSALKLQD